MSEPTGLLRAILADYQDVISGPDVQRGLDAIAALAERATELERERDETQDALQSLAQDHYFARAEAAEERAERAEAEVAFLLSDPDMTQIKAWIDGRTERAEAALREISAVRLPTGNQMGRDELRGCHRARLEMQQIARAALARREAKT